ncbi:MAG: protein kinase domain-containing protein [Planctomycetota bacterium]
MSTPERSVLDLMRAEGRRTPRILLRSIDGEEQIAREGKQRYELLDEIAEGGVGVVWRARDVDLGRPAAIKLLRRAYGRSPETIERFVEEAQIGGQLQHPGIVPVYGLGVLEDFRPYFAMKLVKGRTLNELLAEGADRRKLLSYFERICQTVAYAHARGVIHRDLKPRNVMIGSFDEVQVVDWGFAKVLTQGGVADERVKPEVTQIATVRTESSESDSQTGSVMGTVVYMCPEQAMGMVEELDERADVFSLGAILCEILTGDPPYVRERGSVHQQAVTAKLGPAFEALDGCDADPELIALAKQCLAPLRNERPRNAKAVADRVSGYLTSVEERAHKAELAAIRARSEAAETRERAERAEQDGIAGRRARRQTVALAAAVLLLVVGAGATFLWMRHDRIARERSAMASIDEALREARYREGRQEWVEAIAAAQRSLDLAVAAEAGAFTRGRAEAALARYGEEKKRAEEDAAMVVRLDELRSRWSNGDNHKQTDADFAAAFKEYGHDVGEGEPAEIGAALAKRRIAAELAAALDDWSLLRRAARSLRGSDWKRLLDIARAADPDEFRNKVRDATSVRDVQTLRTLGGADDLPARTLLLLGHGMTVAGDALEGVAVLRRAVLRYPTNPWVHARLAYAFDMLKNRRASVRYFAAAVALRPENAQMNLMLGDALVLIEEASRAVPIYRRAIRFGPHIVRAYVGLGLALYDAKDYRGTISVCEDAIKDAGEHVLPYYLMGTAYTELKEYPPAEEAFKKAAKLGPNYGMVHRELGRLYFMQKKHAEAIQSYEQALKLKPNDFTTRYRKGSCHFSLGEYDKGLIEFRAAQRLMPDHPDVNLWVGRMYWLKREWKNALPWLERAHRLGTARGNWHYPTARFIAQAKAWQHIEPRMPALRTGKEKPKDAIEHRRIAELCYEFKEYGFATRLWKEFDPQEMAARYDAACAAALAGTGRAKDEVADPAEVRALSLGWLQKNLAELEVKPTDVIQRRLKHWKRDADLAGVRDEIDKLPEAEQAAWRAFWKRVDEVLAG